MPNIHYHCLDTPCGRLMVAHEADAMVWAAYVRDDSDDEGALDRVKAWFGAGYEYVQAELESEPALMAYFDGDVTALDDVPFKLVGGTEFQCSIWQTIAKIPYGTVISYAQLAQQVGRPKAVRATGSACGKNPISIVVPCHRVVGTNRRLHGYGGGLDKKTYLLQLEKVADVTLAA